MKSDKFFFTEGKIKSDLYYKVKAINLKSNILSNTYRNESEIQIPHQMVHNPINSSHNYNSFYFLY